jgi:large subunit ribosomal protein L29
MKASELRNKTPAELETLLIDLTREKFSLRMQQGTGQLSKPSQIKMVRRDIAKIKTILTEMGKSKTNE